MPAALKKTQEDKEQVQEATVSWTAAWRLAWMPQ